MDNNNAEQEFWKRKLMAFLHDPPCKPLDFSPKHEEIAWQFCASENMTEDDKEVFKAIKSGKEEYEILTDNQGTHNQLMECDIDFRTRWLQSHYNDQDDLKIDTKDFNICYLDIEVATVGRFPTADRADYPVNCVTIHFSKKTNPILESLQPGQGMLSEEAIGQLTELFQIA